MSVENDALAQAALQFSEAIRAERTSTLDALANERQAALQIISALRTEAMRRSRQARGRFTVGLVLGGALGAAAIYMINQRTSEEVRLGLVNRAEAGGVSLKERFQAALASGRRAAANQEQALWEEYRRRLTEPPKPSRRPDDFLY